jgi:hypothetical protein
MENQEKLIIYDAAIMFQGQRQPEDYAASLAVEPCGKLITLSVI